MTRRCSHCSHNGHNSRTCPNRGVKIFGVRISDGSIRKSASMGNLSHYAAAAGGGGSPADGTENGGRATDGYMSEDLVQGSSSSRERKKGVPWTEEEHKMFLLGLQKLGKGDWRGIARNYVVSRTPTQVASHAQKYFIRQTNASRRKRRTSLFDMVPDEHVDAFLSPMCFQEPETQENHHALPPPAPAPVALEEECESMDSNSNDNEAAVQNPEAAQCSYPVLVPTFVPPFFPLSFPFWPGYCTGSVENKAHEIFKPTASKAAIMVDELGGMSKLSLGESSNSKRPSFLSSKLPDGSDRQSAFHANPPKGGSSSNAIPAV